MISLVNKRDVLRQRPQMVWPRCSSVPASLREDSLWGTGYIFLLGFLMVKQAQWGHRLIPPHLHNSVLISL